MPKIRPATAADAPEIARIYGPYVLTTATFDLDAPSSDEFTSRIDRLRASWPFLVLEGASAGTLSAFAFAEPCGSRAGYAWTAFISTFVDIALDPETGVRLCRTLLDALRDMGLCHAWARLGADSARSEAVYAGAGFERQGLFPEFAYKLGKWYDIIYLGIAIGDGGRPDERPVPFSRLDAAKYVREVE